MTNPQVVGNGNANVTSAQQGVQDARQNYESAQASLTSATSDVQAATTDLTQAQSAATQAASAATAAQNEVNQCTTSLNTATASLRTANSNLSTVRSNRPSPPSGGPPSEPPEGEDRTEYNQALQSYNQAQSDYRNALNQWNSDLASAQQAVESAMQEVNQAQEALNEARTQLESARQAEREANQAVLDAQADLNNAQQVLTQAQEAANQAQQALSQANIQLTEAEQQAAQEAMQAAEQAQRDAEVTEVEVARQRALEAEERARQQEQQVQNMQDLQDSVEEELTATELLEQDTTAVNAELTEVNADLDTQTTLAGNEQMTALQDQSKLTQEQDEVEVIAADGAVPLGPIMGTPNADGTYPPEAVQERVELEQWVLNNPGYAEVYGIDILSSSLDIQMAINRSEAEQNGIITISTTQDGVVDNAFQIDGAEAEPTEGDGYASFDYNVDANGGVVQVMVANGETATIEYDENGNAVVVIHTETLTTSGGGEDEYAAERRIIVQNGGVVEIVTMNDEVTGNQNFVSQSVIYDHESGEMFAETQFMGNTPSHAEGETMVTYYDPMAGVDSLSLTYSGTETTPQNVISAWALPEDSVNSVEVALGRNEDGTWNGAMGMNGQLISAPRPPEVRIEAMDLATNNENLTITAADIDTMNIETIPGLFNFTPEEITELTGLSPEAWNSLDSASQGQMLMGLLGGPEGVASAVRTNEVARITEQLLGPDWESNPNRDAVYESVLLSMRFNGVDNLDSVAGITQTVVSNADDVWAETMEDVTPANVAQMRSNPDNLTQLSEMTGIAPDQLAGMSDQQIADLLNQRDPNIRLMHFYDQFYANPSGVERMILNGDVAAGVPGYVQARYPEALFAETLENGVEPFTYVNANNETVTVTAEDAQRIMNADPATLSPADLQVYNAMVFGLQTASTYQILQSEQASYTFNNAVRDYTNISNQMIADFDLAEQQTGFFADLGYGMVCRIDGAFNNSNSYPCPELLNPEADGTQAQQDLEEYRQKMIELRQARESGDFDRYNQLLDELYGTGVCTANDTSPDAGYGFIELMQRDYYQDVDHWVQSANAFGDTVQLVGSGLITAAVTAATGGAGLFAMTAIGATSNAGLGMLDNYLSGRPLDEGLVGDAAMGGFGGALGWAGNAFGQMVMGSMKAAGYGAIAARGAGWVAESAVTGFVPSFGQTFIQSGGDLRLALDSGALGFGQDLAVSGIFMFMPAGWRAANAIRRGDIDISGGAGQVLNYIGHTFQQGMAELDTAFARAFGMDGDGPGGLQFAYATANNAPFRGTLPSFDWNFGGPGSNVMMAVSGFNGVLNIPARDYNNLVRQGYSLDDVRNLDVIGGDPARPVYRDPNTGETFMLDEAGNRVLVQNYGQDFAADPAMQDVYVDEANGIRYIRNDDGSYTYIGRTVDPGLLDPMATDWSQIDWSDPDNVARMNRYALENLDPGLLNNIPPQYRNPAVEQVILATAARIEDIPPGYTNAQWSNKSDRINVMLEVVSEVYSDRLANGTRMTQSEILEIMDYAYAAIENNSRVLGAGVRTGAVRGDTLPFVINGVPYDLNATGFSARPMWSANEGAFASNAVSIDPSTGTLIVDPNQPGTLSYRASTREFLIIDEQTGALMIVRRLDREGNVITYPDGTPILTEPGTEGAVHQRPTTTGANPNGLTVDYIYNGTLPDGTPILLYSLPGIDGAGNYVDIFGNPQNQILINPLPPGPVNP